MKVIINLVLIFLMIITSGKITKCVVLNKNDNRVLSDSLLNQPKLNIDTLTSTSVSINWSFSSNISGVNYYLEISMNMGAFIPTYPYQKYCNEWSVQDLIPYTRYTFRISLFKDDIFIGHSAPSLVVTTLPGGRPSAPRLITINQINLDFINVTWLSPSIPKNRIIAYNLRIKELSTVTKNLYDATIDISVEEENVSMTPVYITYICQLPHINWIQQEKKIEYNISLYAINANGEDGDTAFYIAYFHSQIQEETKKVLLFSEGPILYRKFIRNDDDIFSPHTPILKLNSNIISISGIVRLNQSIILDQMGTLYIVSNVYSSNTIEIKTVNNTKKIRGSEIDIDWLNNLVYFLDLKRKNIFKCDIPKFENPYLKGCVILKIELEGSLKHLKVDPYNGFIYWIQDDNILIGTNMIGEKKILFSKSVFLSSFSILMKNNYILIPDIIHSRLYTVNLWENKEDFKEAKVFESHCNGLRYITSKNRSSFFWSNHEGLNFQKFTEKYGYLNIIIEQGLNISDILYFDNTNQPFPYPLNPVTGIQVFFYSRLLSIITWKPPFESRLLGFGAWRSWKYNIMVENLKNRRIQQLHSIQCCRYSLPNLNYSTVYKFRIRVEVESSSSSWSVPFITKTFDQENRNAMLVWSSTDSIYLSKSIFPHSDVKKIKINFKISEMSGPYCLTDLGKVCSIFPPMIIYNISSITVLSIAYESIGSQLYISNGSIISRYNIKTFREEILLSVKARSTFLSSSMAIMCWISYSQKDLECSNLNGEGIQKVFAIPTWKNYVILTMCLSEKKDDIFFFIVAQSSLEYRLYHGWNILNIIQFRIIDSYDFFRYNFVNSNLINLSGKLLWKSNLTSFFFYDINGNSITEVPISKNITSFQLITHHQQSVIELHPINVTQLRIEGERKSFFLKWISSQEFQFRISINSKPFRTILKNYIRILNSNNKDSFNLSIYYRNIRTFSPILNTVLTPPESKPEPPKNVRAFKINKKITIRWNPPEHANGIIIQYKIVIDNNDIHRVGRNISEIQFFNNFNTSLIEVRSVNSFGTSIPSRITILPYEVPRVVYMDINKNVNLLDFDDGSNKVLIENVDFYEYFGINEDIWVKNSKVFYRLNDKRVKLIFNSKNTIKLFTIDWFSRTIIWSTNGYTFKSASIDDANHIKPFLLFKSEFKVFKIVCNPSGVYLLTITGLMFKYFSTRLHPLIPDCREPNLLPSNFFIESNELNISLIYNFKIMVRSCIKYSGYRDLLSSEYYEFWISENSKDAVFSSYKNIRMIVSSSPTFLIQVYNPFYRMMFIKTRYRKCWCIKLKKCIDILRITDTNIELRLKKIELDSCRNIAIVPATLYEIQIVKEISLFVVYNHSENVTFTNLIPFTEYNFTIKIYNRYDTEGQTCKLNFRTEEDIPNNPQHVKGLSKTPSFIFVTWMAPLTFNGSVAYMVHAKYSGITSVYNTTDLEYELKGLNPNSLYVIWISAYLRTNISKGYSSSKRISIKTFKSPPLVQVLQKGPRSLKLHWKSPNSETPVVFHQFLLYTKYFISKTNVSFNSVIKFFSQNKSDIRWFPSNSAQRTFPSQNYTTQISTGLYPSTMYIIKVRLFYGEYHINISSQDEQISSLNEFVWPLDDYMLAVNTLPDTPLEPGIPYIFENGTYVILIWSGGDMNIDLYELYGKEINGDGNFYGWNLIYCDVKNFWPPSMLNDSVYKFKVRAKNEHGWSNFSQSSQFININLILQRKKKSEISILVGSICFSISIFCSIVFYLSFTIIKKTSKNQKSISSISNDLVILNEFRDSFVSANNPLYNLIGENLSPIKHFSLSQLSFKTKLGSGAFGNVYEGTLQCSEHGSRNVALKTLKYNAKEITKKEFIKEALIMSKFNHPNILKLIGTCVDGGPTILVMELMEMDLLELLRSKRSLTDRSTILGKNLVRFCLDIARGCLYLTQMRHVHRDIAARNCLVSLPTSDHTHLVKIGDFGRAREIYRDDYYRKGGLMPIRWMAPESLEDGVYTHQTDVWSYGIVLWEIISFGKQPYPGMSHLDVYHYVCNLRKTLDVPLKCPHILYQLMTQCWSYEPINRPSFKECVDEIEELLLYKDELNGISFTEHIHQLESNSYTKKILNPATLSVTESNVPYLEVISSNNMITNI